MHPIQTAGVAVAAMKIHPKSEDALRATVFKSGR
jgi:hypothetical protein